MCLFNKKYKQVDSKLNELLKLIKDNELPVLRQKALTLSEKENLLSHIQLKVKSCKHVVSQDDGRVHLLIDYMPIQFDFIVEDGEVKCNEMFKAINMLDLIDIDDMKKIVDEIEISKKV